MQHACMQACVQAGRQDSSPDQPTTTSTSPALSARTWSELLNTRTCSGEWFGVAAAAVAAAALMGIPEH